VIIPAMDEAETVGGVVRAARAAGAFEVIVVSDGSSDDTPGAAREAGASVIVFQENQGKSAAIEAAAKAASGATLVMLDADLVDLSPEHVRRLFERVVSGELDMAVGVFRGGGLMTDFGNRATPFLSGQRACTREWLLSIPDLTARRWPEPAMTAHLARSGARWDYIDLENVKQVMKEQKRGFVEGMRHRLKMYRQLIGYVVRPRRG
jgi:glycosyltransferase involved in cell wall biosynthesis